MAIFCMIQTPFNGETFAPIIQRRIAKRRGEQVPPKTPLTARLGTFARVGLIRPLHMLFAEPIVTFLCLYVAVNFGILFSFFAAVPYTFTLVYGFDLEHSGLVFLSIVVGCFLGLLTILLCDILIYRPRTARHPLKRIPPVLVCVDRALRCVVGESDRRHRSLCVGQPMRLCQCHPVQGGHVPRQRDCERRERKQFGAIRLRRSLSPIYDSE